MCRMAGYLGDPLRLEALVDRAPHGLLHQSWAAREMKAAVNADGWGAGFYLPGDEAPAVYVSTAPVWSDPNRAHLGRAITSTCLLAAVRSATDPFTVSSANTQPFTAGRLLFLHNGFIESFRGEPARRIAASLGPAAWASLRGTTDSEHLFALVLDELEGKDLLSACIAAVGRASAVAVEHGVRGFFSLIAGDGERLVGLRAATHGDAPSLYVLPGPTGSFPGTVIASEPLDAAPGWRPVEAGTAVVVERGRLSEVQLG